MELEVQEQFDYNTALDAAEMLMRKHGVLEIKPIHVFSPGFYTRSIIVPPNTYLLSHVHKTEHQYIMSAGEIIIYTEDGGMMLYSGPYLGKTYAGTRRFALTLSKVTWTSIYATDIQPKNKTKKAFSDAVKSVEQELFENHLNTFLIKNQWPELQQHS